MGGVVDEDGQQWERCNECGRWVKFEHLRYEPPSAAHTCGRDLCGVCWFNHLRVKHFGGQTNGSTAQSH